MRRDLLVTHLLDLLHDKHSFEVRLEAADRAPQQDRLLLHQQVALSRLVVSQASAYLGLPQYVLQGGALDVESSPGLAGTVQAGIYRDSIDPGLQRRLMVELVDASPDLGEDILRHIFRIVRVTQDPQGDTQDQGSIFVEQL